MATYGTLEERRQISQIRTRFKGAIVMNPARYDGALREMEDPMEYCRGMVYRCDIVVFACYKGSVTAGVGIEANYALKCGIRVFEMTRSGFRARRRPLRYLNREQTRRLFRRISKSPGGKADKELADFF